MDFQEIYSRFDHWSKQIPYTTQPGIYDTYIDTDFYTLSPESLEEQKQRFQEFIPREDYGSIAKELAQAVDENRTQVKDLDNQGRPKDILSHKGARHGDSNQADQVLNSVLKFFEVLICYGYQNQEDEELQVSLKNFASTIYDFLEHVYRESQSLASYLDIKVRVRNIATHITKSIIDPDQDDYEKAEEAVSEYTSFINSSFMGDELNEKQCLEKYGSSINSYSNIALLDYELAFVDDKYLRIVEEEIDEEISQASEDEASMIDLRNKFEIHAKNIDTCLKDLPVEDEHYQYSLIWFIAVREFFAECGEDYERWADFRDRMQIRYLDAEDFEY